MGRNFQFYFVFNLFWQIDFLDSMFKKKDVHDFSVSTLVSNKNLALVLGPLHAICFSLHYCFL